MITLSPTPLSTRPCAGLGVQADSVIYDDLNRQAGVTDADYALHERRLRALRPGVARVFISITDFNPSADAATYEWDTPAMQRQRRNLETLRDAGARVNVCMAPFTNREMMQPGMEDTAVALMEHLAQRGFDNIRWLTLFNEPDSLYADDTEPFRRYFTDNKTRPPWAEYVAKHHRTYTQLQERGLAERITLVAPDAVMGPPIRRARLELAVRDFAGLPVSYAFHHYTAQYPHFYAHPDSAFFAPPLNEMADYRAIVGDAAELICWEFNNAGYGMSTFWTGCGPRGEGHLETVENAVYLAWKVMAALESGIDGMGLWCLNDVFYTGNLANGLMYFGLWRYKWEAWAPRPCFYYYAALIEAFRPGTQLYAVQGTPAGVIGLAARGAEGTTVALLNFGEASQEMTLAIPGLHTRLRVAYETLPSRPDSFTRPCPEADHPLQSWERLPEGPAARTLTLAPGELTLLR